MVRFAFLFILIAGAFPVDLGASKRLAIIDVESDYLSPTDRNALLNFLRTRMGAKKSIPVIPAEEFEPKILQKSSARAEAERAREDQEKKRAEIEAKLLEGKNLYLGSHFEEAINNLRSAFVSLKEISLVLPPTLPAEILELIGASYFFLGDQQRSKDYFGALLDLDPSYRLDEEKFPPDLVASLEALRSEGRYPWELWTVQSNVNGFAANFLGIKLPTIDEPNGLSVKVPVRHPILGFQDIILSKEGYAPLSLAVDQLPKSVTFQTIEDRRHPTTGLFGVVPPDATPPAELKWFIQQTQAGVLFLGSAAKNETGAWFLQGQWLEATTGRTSPVMNAVDPKLQRSAQDLLDQLSNYVTADGIVIQDQLSHAEPITQEVYEVKTPFYKTWWFWTLAGAGVAGAGVLTYMILSPKETLQFEMKGP